MFSRLTRRFPGLRSRRRPVGRQLQIEGLEGRSLLTAIPINFGATVTSAPVAINGELFFAANDATHGKQLWESNGTAAGTIRLTDGNDANGGINPTDLTVVGGTLYFAADDGLAAFGGVGNGDQLWKSDGTAAGTAMVTDGNDGVANAGLFPCDLTDVGGTLYFAGCGPPRRRAALQERRHGGGHDDGRRHPGGQRLSRVLSHRPDGRGRPALLLGHDSAGHGTQLWATNGTAAGTVHADLRQRGRWGHGPQYLTAASGTVYFSGFDPTDRFQLWASNGTAARDGAADHRQRGEHGHEPAGS